MFAIHGTSLAFNGRNHQTAFAPMIAIWLTHYSLTYVGFYLSAAACIFVFLLMISKEEHKF
jgi:hypothetical protein